VQEKRVKGETKSEHGKQWEEGKAEASANNDVFKMVSDVQGRLGLIML